jgi:hypothetical protein
MVGFLVTFGWPLIEPSSPSEALHAEPAVTCV